MKYLVLLTALAFYGATSPLNAQKVETRSLSDFNRIAISGGFVKVILKQGDTESVRIESEGVDLEQIQTDVKGNQLHLGVKSQRWSNKGRVKLIVTYRQLTEINNSGSTDIQTENTLNGGELTYNGSGSGYLMADLDVKSVKVNISGSSDINLSGKANEQSYAISGSGDINARLLKGQSAKVAVSGSGDVEINVSGNVKSSVSGSGKVRNVHE